MQIMGIIQAMVLNDKRELLNNLIIRVLNGTEQYMEIAYDRIDLLQEQIDILNGGY